MQVFIEVWISVYLKQCITVSSKYKLHEHILYSLVENSQKCERQEYLYLLPPINIYPPSPKILYLDSRVDLEFTILVDFHLLLIFFCLLFFFCKRLLEFEMKEGRRGSIERMRRTHRGSIERMRRTHRGSIERMRRTHKGSIERMRRTHKGSFERMRWTNTFFSYERTRKNTHTLQVYF